MSALQSYQERDDETEGIASISDSSVCDAPQRHTVFTATEQAVDAFADSLASPALAAAWADAIVCYWEAELADGRIDVEAPVYLLDLAPSRGRLAWLLIHALDERLAGSAASWLDYRYIACDHGDRDHDNDGRSAAWNVDGGVQGQSCGPRLSPVLPPQLQSLRRFGVASWRADIGSVLALAGEGPVLTGTANPTVALALGLFHRQPSGLFAAHWGQWLAGSIPQMRLAPAIPDGETCADDRPSVLPCEWHAPRAGLSDARCEPLAAYYVEQIPSAALTVPGATLRMLDALSRFCERTGYLLLSAANGVCAEYQLRAGWMAPSWAWIEPDALPPVNFHALVMFEKSRASAVYQRQLGDHGTVVHAAWWRAGTPPSEARADALWARLNAHHPDDSAHQAACAQALASVAPVAALLACLRLSHYDPRVFESIASGWEDRPLQLTDSEADACRRAVTEVWRRHVPDTGDPVAHHALAVLAMRIGHWRIACEIWRTRIEHHPHDGAAHYYLARCLAATGHLDDARAHSARAAELAPENRACAALHRVLRMRAARWRALPWYRPELSRDVDLRVEPLGVNHADALLLQSRADPHIALITGLPELTDRHQVLEWMNSESHQPGRCSFAATHADLGFIGIVSYQRAGASAYFYLCLGAIAQGAGFGSRAARLLLAQAAAAGVTDLFTSSYSDNVRSSRTLVRVGFNLLDYADTRNAPDEVRYFHASLVGRVHAKDDLIARLSELCDAIGAQF